VTGLTPITFISCLELSTRALAPLVNSFFRVSRRVNEGHFVRFEEGKKVDTLVSPNSTPPLHAETTPNQRSNAPPRKATPVSSVGQCTEHARSLARPRGRLYTGPTQSNAAAEKVQPSTHSCVPRETWTEFTRRTLRASSLIPRRP
jgi:hypothetical protein